MLSNLAAVLFTVSNALAVSGFDVARKVLTRDVSPTAVAAIASLGPAPVFVVWTTMAGDAVQSAGYLAPGLLCMVLNSLAHVAFVKALQVSQLSVTVPLLAFTPMITAIVAVPMLGEVIEWPTLVGVAAVMIGALLLHADGTRRGVVQLLHAMARERGSLLMGAAAFMWSTATVLDKIALEFASLPFHGLVQTGGGGVFLVLVLLARKQGSELNALRDRPGACAAAIGFSLAHAVLHLAAVQATLVAIVETVKRGVAMTLAVVFGRAFFAEPILPSKVIAIVLMAAGAATAVL